MGNGTFSGMKSTFRTSCSCMAGVGEVATIATIVLQRWTNVPTNFAVLSERGSGGSRDVGNNFCTRGSKGSAIVVELAKHGGMCRKGGMDARGSEKIQRQSCLW